MTSCGRTRQSQHRRGAAELAQGLDLPGPPRGSFCTFQGHVQIFEHSSTDLDARYASLAAGISVWHNSAGKKLSREDDKARCLCGSLFPSRPHLVWCCPAFQESRIDVPSPVNRAEERLFARAVNELPRPPEDTAVHGVKAELLQAIAELVQTSDNLFLATDGSAKNHVASWGIFVPCSDRAFAAGVEGEDQSAFRAELEAIRAALAAVFAASSQGIVMCRHLTIVSDCTAAIWVASGFEGDVIEMRARRFFELRRSLRAVGIGVDFKWVPSHGKIVRGWAPHPRATEAQLRAWNHAADRAANGCMQRLLAGSARLRWATNRKEAKTWELAAIRAAARISAGYRAHCES
ncbi:unnamed protein product [Effrenium voratum]|uniref:Uncharacterized protein n=1 Tax=Effrenium voratum TaxID=2562239 RepID=A0AA36NHN4_9DINO|nr:unnamed protein product [Effrenium voratum]